MSEQSPRILSLDAGGLRGIFTIQVLAELERRTGRPLHESFDMIVGVSTGAIIAFASALQSLDTGQMEERFLHFGRRLFDRSRATSLLSLVTERALVSAEVADGVARDFTGESRRLDEDGARRPAVACIAADRGVSPGRTCVFSSYPRRGFPFHGTDRVLAWKALRASCTVPFLFDVFVIEGLELDGPSHRIQYSADPREGPSGPRPFLDGGLISANPSEIAYWEGCALFGRDSQPVVVSIGTGRMLDPTAPEMVGDRLTSVALAALDIAMSTQHVLPMMAEMLGDRYFRIDGPVEQTHMFDVGRVESWRRSGQSAAQSYPRWDELLRALRERSA